MTRLFLIISYLLFQTNLSFGQVSNYKNLIDTATHKNVKFVQMKPLTEFELNIRDTSEYQDYLFGETLSKFKIDIKILLEIINNSKLPDSTFWTDKELDKFILVKSRDENVSLQYVINKFQPDSKSEIKNYRRTLRQYNQTAETLRNIFSFSKPVFDNSKLFAIVCYDKGHSGLHCRGQITLYHFIDDKWQTIGDIYNCIY
jgi:GH15 family glucan-1,4-alpha-glucosidase